MKRNSIYIIIPLILLLIGTKDYAALILPKLYIPTQNTAVGSSNWIITNAVTDNAAIDFWKMLTGSMLTTPTMDLTGYTAIQIAIELQSVGTITANSDDIKLEYWNGNSWSQIGSNLHSSETPVTEFVSLPYADAVAKIRFTAPNSGVSTGAGILSIEITGTVTPIPTPTLAVTDVSISNLNATVGEIDSETIMIEGVHLTTDVTLSLSGANADQFSLSTNTIAQSAGSTPNTVTTITYAPGSAGTHTANLTLSTAGSSDIIRTLIGNASIATGLKNNKALLILRKLNGNIIFKAEKGEVLTICNALGQNIMNKITTEGINTIPVPSKGVIIVKVGTKAARIIL